MRCICIHDFFYLYFTILPFTLILFSLLFSLLTSCILLSFTLARLNHVAVVRELLQHGADRTRANRFNVSILKLLQQQKTKEQDNKTFSTVHPTPTLFPFFYSFGFNNNFSSSSSSSSFSSFSPLKETAATEGRHSNGHVLTLLSAPPEATPAEPSMTLDDIQRIMSIQSMALAQAHAALEQVSFCVGCVI